MFGIGILISGTLYLVKEAVKCSINVIYLCGKLILPEVVELEDTFAFVMEKIQMLFGIEYNTHKILREKNGLKIYCIFF